MKQDYAYRYIKNLIFERKWDFDTAINVNEIADQLKMSRTPVHKALTQLQQEGFLTIIPQVGVFVKAPDLKEVLERVVVCANLDALLAEQAASRLNDEDFNHLYLMLTEMDDSELSHDEYARLNVEFHSKIYQASGLEYTIEMTKKLWDYLNFVGTPELLFIKQRRKRSQAEHWMIYYALLDRDSKLVKELVENHMRRVAEVIERKYADIQSSEKVLMD